ncbi:hypothetical protein ACROYT_G033162 [Oculina patagonica]
MANDTAIQCLFLIYHEMKKTKPLITMSVIVSVWNGMLLIVALVANGLVCAAILKNSELRSRASNTLLLLLSMSDFFVGFAVQPLYLLRRLLELQDRYICWVMVSYRVLWHLSIGSSFLILCFVACERYIALFFTFRYNQIITISRLVLFTAFFVASWTLFVISRFLGLSTGKYYATATSFIILFVSIIIFVYIRIYRLARRHHSQICCMQSAQSSTIARESKVTKTTAYIVGAVLICYSPLLIALVAVKFFDDKIFHYYVFPVTDCMVFCNSALNPLIYCWRNADLRRCIGRLLGIGVRRETTTQVQEFSPRHNLNLVSSTNGQNGSSSSFSTELQTIYPS